MVEPYNSVLHCHYSIEHCDVSFLVDNQVQSKPLNVITGLSYRPLNLITLRLPRLLKIVHKNHRLMLSFSLCYHSVNVIIQFMLSFSLCYHSVNVIIQLMLSLFPWPKKITLSTFYCISIQVRIAICQF